MISPPAPTHALAALAIGTPVVVTLDQDLSSATSKVGDVFRVTVLHDVVVGDVVAIARGAIGHGRITFVAKRGDFGKAGILAMALHDVDLGGKTFLLDGHYQEDGTRRNNTAAAVMFAAGVLSLAIKGGEAVIPKGRALKARTGEVIPYSPNPPYRDAFPVIAFPADGHVPPLADPEAARPDIS